MGFVTVGGVGRGGGGGGGSIFCSCAVRTGAGASWRNRLSASSEITTACMATESATANRNVRRVPGCTGYEATRGQVPPSGCVDRGGAQHIDRRLGVGCRRDQRGGGARMGKAHLAVRPQRDCVAGKPRECLRVETMLLFEDTGGE